jgi:hypothetical protein
VTVGLEPTGHYHRPLAWRLVQAGFDVRTISSVALARTREALHNGWDKNDPKDAQVILHMLRIGAAKPYHDPLAHGINDIQELSMTHEAVSKAKTETLTASRRTTCRSTSPRSTASATTPAATGSSPCSSAFPCRPASPALSKEDFVAAAWDLAGRKVAKARLLGDIYETAQSSIALPIRTGCPGHHHVSPGHRRGAPPDRAARHHRATGYRASRIPSRLPTSAAGARHRADQCARHPGRGG